ncbi:hypothetical protein Ciccas_013327, partial [Cichlidogyrus casuarinus]
MVDMQKKHNIREATKLIKSSDAEFHLNKMQMFSYYSIIGIFALTDVWNDKMEKKKLDFIEVLTKKLGDCVENYSFEVESFNAFMKELLEMLRCDKLSQQYRLVMFEKMIDQTKDMRNYNEEKFPNEWKDASDTCLKTANEMKNSQKFEDPDI